MAQVHLSFHLLFKMRISCNERKCILTFALFYEIFKYVTVNPRIMPGEIYMFNMDGTWQTLGMKWNYG